MFKLAGFSDILGWWLIVYRLKKGFVQKLGLVSLLLSLRDVWLFLDDDLHGLAVHLSRCQL